MNAQEHEFDPVDIDRGDLRSVSHKQPVEDLESLREVLLLLADIVDELRNATLHFVPMMYRSLQVVVLQLEELIQICLHFILHLNGMAEENLRVYSRTPVLPTEFKLLQLLVMLVF